MSEYYQKFITDYPVYAENPLIKKAFDIAEKSHEGQVRRSGEPYIIHPYEVVRILADMGLDDASICAGMLHDVPEDTEFDISDVEKAFGSEIAAMVDGVTKLKNFEFKSREEAHAESMRKMFLAMAADIRVIIIKLADRLHNMRTLGYTSERQQHEKATETLEIYAPLAHRLGINTFKWEFEDLALKYLEPEAYFEIASMLKSTRTEREQYISGIMEQLKETIDKLGIKYSIEGRPKHIYSIYKKMHNKNKTFDELYDLVAVRIIVDSIKDCYAILGTVHAIWRPLPMRFKDYIAVPKQNMYQSLHTTLLGADGKPFEVQIRTEEMHRTAEYGVAAHWKYKEGNSGDADFDNKLTWIRELMEWQGDMRDSKEFVEALKTNFFSDNVFVFTPKGDIKNFVKGSTPLDFAYGVHSQVGNKCIGAKVNGKLVPLNYALQTGDIVEIITSSSAKGPSRDWLALVKTATARSKIRAWFKKEGREENVRKGKELLEREARRRGYDIHTLMRQEWLKGLFKRYTLSSADDMYSAIGFGGLTTKQVLARLIEAYKIEHEEELSKNTPANSAVTSHPRKSDIAIDVEGEPDMLVRLAHCCNPLPGDKIVGYITRGRGVTVHRADCSNLNDTDFQPERMVHVSWVEQNTSKYEVEIQIRCDDRPGLLAEISQALYLAGYSILSLNARMTKEELFLVTVKIEVAAIRDLESLMNKLRGIESVTEVYRLNN